MIKQITLAAAAVMLALPAQAEAPKPMPVTLTGAQTAIVKEAVMAKLRDPESARFSGIKATGTIFNHKVTGLPVLDGQACGFVNAKNGYGGYMGMMPFSVMLLGDEVFAHPRSCTSE
jgi:hypothetical protein